MYFAVTRATIASRTLEVRQALSVIDDRAARGDNHTNILIDRGLSLVFVYSLFEFSINRTFTEFITLINNKNIPYNEAAPHLMTLSLKSDFDSIAKEPKQTRKLQLINSARSSNFIKIDDSIFSKILMNIWAKTFSDLFNVQFIFQLLPKNILAKI